MMKPFCKNMLAGLLVASFSSASALAVDTSGLQGKTKRILEMLSHREGQISYDEVGQIDRHLNAIRNIIEGRDSQPPVYPRPEQGNLYEAECHMDDDVDFTFGQKVEKLSGRNLRELIDNCKYLAESTYRQNSSFGLKNLKLTQIVPSYMQSAVCQIDDDNDFTADQTVIGVLAGRSMIELAEDCAKIATLTYGKDSSSGLKDINAQRVPPAGMSSAECWIDDDPDFTTGQFRGGVIWGATIRDIGSQCAFVAEKRYGSKGSSGLSNIKN